MPSQNLSTVSASPTVSDPSSTPTPSLNPGLDTNGGNQVGAGQTEDIYDVDGASTCFPGAARVMVGHGEWRRMDELNIGDVVMSGKRNTSEIFMFSHRDPRKSHKFVRLGLEDGGYLTLTAAHYLYLNNDKMVNAGSVKLGDVLATPNRQGSEVVSIDEVWESGLYNPHSLSGELVVEGIRTSCYTTAIRPQVAHNILAPLRVVWRLTRIDVVKGMLDYGCTFCNLFLKVNP